MPNSAARKFAHSDRVKAAHHVFCAIAVGQPVDPAYNGTTKGGVGQHCQVLRRPFGNRGSTWQWCNGRHARELSMLAGLDRITFEVAAVAWIGFQPIEGVFALVGAAVLAFAAAWRQQ